MLKAIQVICDNYPTACSTASVRSVKGILYKNGYIVLNDQIPFQVVTLRSVVESEGKLLSECIDNFPSVTKDTGINEILSIMGSHETDYLMVIENDDFIGVITSKSIANKLTKKNNDLNNRFNITMHHPIALVYTQDRYMRYSCIYSTCNNCNPTIFIGKTDHQIFNNEDAMDMISIKQRVLDTGEPVNAQIKVSKEEKTYHYKLFVEPIINDDSVIDGLLCATIDITDIINKNEQLEKSRSHFAELANSIAEICFALDRKFIITYWGKTLGQISGISPDKAVGKHVEELYTLFPRRERLVNLIREVFLTGKVVRTTFKYSEKMYDFNMYPFSDGVMVIAFSKSHGSLFQSSYTELWEKELKNTVQTIHNDLGQYIAALSMRCAELEIKVKTGAVISCEDLSNINMICSSTSDSLRNLIQSILWRSGNAVPDANIIQRVCTTIEKSFGVIIDIQIQEGFFPSGIFEREHIIKFIQEALLNAAKHSGSHLISLSADHNDKYLTYIICDNGQGFDVSGKNNGMGLKMMQFNADELAGEMKISSGIAGTTVTLLIPRY